MKAPAMFGKLLRGASVQRMLHMLSVTHNSGPADKEPCAVQFFDTAVYRNRNISHHNHRKHLLQVVRFPQSRLWLPQRMEKNIFLWKFPDFGKNFAYF